MSDWLDLMLEEIARKKRELEEAKKELERRGEDDGTPPADAKQTSQSK